MFAVRPLLQGAHLEIASHLVSLSPSALCPLPNRVFSAIGLPFLSLFTLSSAFLFKTTLPFSSNLFVLLPKAKVPPTELNAPYTPDLRVSLLTRLWVSSVQAAAQSSAEDSPMAFCTPSLYL